MTDRPFHSHGPLPRIDPILVAGAYWGEWGIPQEWLETLARRDMIEKVLIDLLKSQG